MSIGNSLGFQAANNHLLLGNFDLTLGSVSGAGADRFITTGGGGRVLKNLTGAFTFPVGFDKTTYNPLMLTQSGAPDVLGLRCLQNVFSNSATGTPYTQETADVSWDLTEQTPGGSMLAMQFQWAGSDELPGFTRNIMEISRHNGASWQPAGTQGSATGSDPYQFSITGINAPGVFAVANQCFLHDTTLPTVTCVNSSVTFNGQSSITLDAGQFVSASDNCGVQSISLSPSTISATQVGQTVPVTVTVTDVKGNVSTCISNITVSGLPAGWSAPTNGIGCTNGSNVNYNTATGVWTATSTNCFYGPPFTADSEAFAQRTLCGDGSITTLVTGINPLAGGWAGVVMRESNAAGAKKAQLLTNLSNLSRREFRTATNGTAIPQQFPSQNRYWLRITRAGNQFTMSISPNGMAWYVAGGQNIVMQSCIEVGLVLTNYTSNSTVTGTFSNVGFTQVNPISTGQAQEQPTLGQVEFDVFPNPTSGELNLDLTQYIGRSVRIEMYSLEGKLLQFSELDEVQNTLERLDLKGFQSGMYLVKVKSAGLPDATKRIVLQRG